MQVWNCYKVGLDTNGKYHKVVYNYKLLPGECMWKVKIVEWAPLWFTLLVLPNPMGNISCHPSCTTNKNSNPNISTSTFHWTGYSTTHNTGIWINTCGLKSWPNYSLYVVSPPSTVEYFSLIGMKFTLMNTPFIVWITKISNPSSWSQSSLIMTIPKIMSQIQNWSHVTMMPIHPGFLSISPQKNYLTTWTWSCRRCGTPLRCPPETSPGRYFLIKINLPSVLSTLTPTYRHVLPPSKYHTGLRLK